MRTGTCSTTPSSRPAGNSTSALVQTTGGAQFSMGPAPISPWASRRPSWPCSHPMARRRQQYFIFLSDGAPGNLDAGRQPVPGRLRAGRSIRRPPSRSISTRAAARFRPTIRTMTTNIQANGYSTTNANSAASRFPPAGHGAAKAAANLRDFPHPARCPRQGKSVVRVGQWGGPRSTTTRRRQRPFRSFQPHGPGGGHHHLQFTYTHTFLDNSVSSRPSTRTPSSPTRSTSSAAPRPGRCPGSSPSPAASRPS